MLRLSPNKDNRPRSPWIPLAGMAREGFAGVLGDGEYAAVLGGDR